MPLFVMKNSSLNRASSPATMALVLRNLAGEVARRCRDTSGHQRLPNSTPPGPSLATQTAKDRSSSSQISSCSLANAFSPSPCSIGIDTPKIPSRQYAISFTLVVLLFAAYDILLTTGASARTVLSRRTWPSIPVTASSALLKPAFVPRSVHPLSRNSATSNAISSCSLHPLVNHWHAANLGISFSGPRRW
jgi:hypothetical protein